jgi:hypothetical protein
LAQREVLTFVHRPQEVLKMLSLYMLTFLAPAEEVLSDLLFETDLQECFLVVLLLFWGHCHKLYPSNSPEEKIKRIKIR